MTDPRWPPPSQVTSRSFAAGRNHRIDRVLCATPLRRRLGAQRVSIGSGLAKCKSKGRKGSLSYDMRFDLRVLAWVALRVVLTPGSVLGQGILTPADSAILASQPLKRLVLAPSVLRRISLLAAGLDREVVLCFQGTVAGDTALVRDFEMPDLVSSTADQVQPAPCAPGTLAVWHNHPWTGPDSTFGVKTPEDLCSLSQPDLRSVIADSVPFAVVSVGRTGGGPIVCWWRRVQAVVNQHVKFLPRFPRQWLEWPTLAGPGDP